MSKSNPSSVVIAIDDVGGLPEEVFYVINKGQTGFNKAMYICGSLEEAERYLGKHPSAFGSQVRHIR